MFVFFSAIFSIILRLKNVIMVMRHRSLRFMSVFIFFSVTRLYIFIRVITVIRLIMFIRVIRIVGLIGL
jgi:hypothetical protein